MDRLRRPSTAVVAGTLCLIWALTFIAQRTALREAQPLWVAAGRTGLGALVLLPALRPLGARGWRIAAWLGLANVVGFVGLQLLGLEAIGAGPAAAIVYAQPVLVAVGAYLLLGEEMTRARVAGVLLGFAGVAVVSAHELSAASVFSVAALLGCAVCWATGTLGTRATPELPALPVVAAQHLLAAPVLLALAAATEPAPAPSARLAGSLLFAGVFGAAFGLFLFTLLLRRGEASVVTAWLFTVPILAAVFGVVLLGEPLRAPLVVGLVLVSVGVRLASRRPRARAVPPARRSSARPAPAAAPVPAPSRRPPAHTRS